MPDAPPVNEPPPPGSAAPDRSDPGGSGTRTVPLNRLGAGTLAKVIDVEVDSADARRLKALGLCAGRTVEVLSTGDPLVVRVVGSRVGLSAQLAQHVLVSNH